MLASKMSSTTEEDILLQLLPQMEGRLDFRLLKPHLKLSCSLTDMECQLLFECSQNTSTNKSSNGAHIMLVELLRKRGPHCCARMLLNALKQLQKNSQNLVSDHDHTGVIKLLQAELKRVNKDPQQLSRGAEMDSVSNVSLQESDSLNYFPSAVPDSPSNRIPPSVNRPFASSQPPQNPLSQYNTQATNVNIENSGNKMAVVISVGPSRQPVPLMRYEFLNSPISSKDIEEESYELIMKSKAIQSKFSHLILDVCSLLQDSPTAYIEKLQMWLSFQSCSQSAQSLRVLDGNSDTLKAKTIPALISSLHCYSSWYNYGLIADIAKQFCGDEGSTLVKAYELELKDYLQSLISHCPPLFPGLDEVNGSQELESLEVKVGWDPSTSLLEDITIFKHTLSQLCELDPRFLVVKRISNSDFQVSFAIPKSAVGKINQTIKLNPGAFFHNNIDAIKLSGTQTNFKPNASTEEMMKPSEKAGSRYQDESPLSGQAKKEAHQKTITANSNSGSVPALGIKSLCTDTLQKSTKTPLASFRVHRDKKALSLGTTLPNDIAGSSLLSEISKSLETSDLFPFGSIATLSSPKQAESKPTSEKGESVAVFHAYDRNSKKFSGSIDIVSQTNTNSSVSFLWRVLGRARPGCHANIHVVSIQAVYKVNEDDISVRKGQHLKALYRVSDRIFVESPSFKQGFVLYSSCRLSLA